MPAISDVVQSKIETTEQRLSRLMFKQVVELAKICNILAFSENLSPESIRALHARCVQEVSSINGVFTFEDAVDFQNGKGE